MGSGVTSHSSAALCGSLLPSSPSVCTPVPQASFSMKEKGEIAESGPIPIRFALHNKRLFGHCLDCHFSENLLFD